MLQRRLEGEQRLRDDFNHAVRDPGQEHALADVTAEDRSLATHVRERRGLSSKRFGQVPPLEDALTTKIDLAAMRHVCSELDPHLAVECDTQVPLLDDVECLLG